MISAPDHYLADILIVDDTLANLRLLTQMLSSAGYRVRPVTSGADALATSCVTPPDLVLLDVMMPEMDGFEVAARLRAAAQTRHTPIIFISALDDAESKLRAFAVGGADYVAKPFHTEEVLARIATHLRLQREIAQREGLIEELQLLNKISRSLIVYDDPEEMFQTVVEHVMHIMGGERAFLMRVDDETESILQFVQVGRGLALLPLPTYADVLDGLPGWVIKRTQPVLSLKEQRDPREGPRARELRAAYQIGSAIIAPLYCQGQMLGVLSVTRSVEDEDFTRENLATLNAIAAQTAVAARSMELAEETGRLKEFNEGIVQGVAEAILITDVEDMITFANPAALAMLGHAEPDLVGQSALAIVPAEYRERVQLENTRRVTGQSGHYESELRHRDGRIVPVLVNARPLFQGGNFAGTLTAFTDITELKQAEAQLRQYAADLESQNAELDAFAHTVAHDLKSPLTVLIGFADLLRARSKKFLPREREQLQMIAQTGHKMRAIIEELLLLSSVRTVDEIKVAPLDMAAIVGEVQARLAYLVQETQAEVITPAQWPLALGYAPWIEEVWINYLSNALKYGGRPDVDLPPRLELGGDAGETQPCFWVCDNGLGLSPEQQRLLFTPFERLHSGRVDGHGLGLSIVRRIIEKLGGSVSVESVVGEGSRFCFTLPTASMAGAANTAQPSAAVLWGRKAVTVAETRSRALAAQPAAWRAKLRAATIDADVKRIAAVIAACRARDPDLAAALQALAEAFAHDEILRWLALAEA